jgi:hypothetical protein
MIGIMQKQFLLFLLLALALTPLSAKVYKWVDAEGNVQYSDKPVEGAETVKVPKSNIYTPAPIPDSEDQPGAGTDATDGSYTTFSIAEPENDQTIRSNEGQVRISFFIEPTLYEGDKIALYLDGQKMKGEHTTMRLSLTNLERGTHTLKAEVLSAEGEQRASAKPVVFHLRKASIKKSAKKPSEGAAPPSGYEPNYKP